jgi:hypothetical protein
MNRLKKAYSTCMSCGGKKMKSGGNWIKKAVSKNPGSFTAQAKRAGMSVPAFRDKVLSNKESYSGTTVKRANLAKTLSKMRKGADGMLNTSGVKTVKNIPIKTTKGQTKEMPRMSTVVSKDRYGVRKAAAGMMEAATPGPLMQKLKAMTTRAKYNIGQGVGQVKGATNQAAQQIASDVSTRVENAQTDNVDRVDEVRSRVSARKAARDKNRYERNVSSPNAPMFRGENLPGNRRAAIAAISENLNTELEGRARKKLAAEYYESLDKPKTQAELLKQRSKLQRNAIMGPTGYGVGTGSGPTGAQMQTVCPLTGGCGGRKGMLVKKKVQPLSSYRKK